jgi:hypothetical protein
MTSRGVRGCVSRRDGFALPILVVTRVRKGTRVLLGRARDRGPLCRRLPYSALPLRESAIRRTRELRGIRGVRLRPAWRWRVAGPLERSRQRRNRLIFQVVPRFGRFTDRRRRGPIVDDGRGPMGYLRCPRIPHRRRLVPGSGHDVPSGSGRVSFDVEGVSRIVDAVPYPRTEFPWEAAIRSLEEFLEAGGDARSCRRESCLSIGEVSSLYAGTFGFL